MEAALGASLPLRGVWAANIELELRRARAGKPKIYRFLLACAGASAACGAHISPGVERGRGPPMHGWWRPASRPTPASPEKGTAQHHESGSLAPSRYASNLPRRVGSAEDLLQSSGISAHREQQAAKHARLFQICLGSLTGRLLALARLRCCSL